MSYQQSINWNKKHYKGTKQPLIFSTHSGFWLSQGFLDEYNIYTEVCQKQKIIPWNCEKYYNARLVGKILCYQSLAACVEWSKNHPE